MSGLPATTRSSATDGVPAKPTMNTTNTFGCDAESVIPAGRRSPSCLIGWRLRRLSPCIADSRLVRTSAARASVEQAAPHCQDPSRSPDPSTLRRWARRRLLSVCCWVKAGATSAALFAGAHHPCLGSRRTLPYSADRGKKSVNRQALDDFKQQIPLMGYLQAHDWHPARPLSPWPMDGVVPFAWRSQAKLPGGYQQRPFLLLRLRPRRRRDSLR